MAVMIFFVSAALVFLFFNHKGLAGEIRSALTPGDIFLAAAAAVSFAAYFLLAKQAGEYLVVVISVFYITVLMSDTRVEGPEGFFYAAVMAIAMAAAAAASNRGAGAVLAAPISLCLMVFVWVINVRQCAGRHGINPVVRIFSVLWPAYSVVIVFSSGDLLLTALGSVVIVFLSFYRTDKGIKHYCEKGSFVKYAAVCSLALMAQCVAAVII